MKQTVATVISEQAFSLYSFAHKYSIPYHKTEFYHIHRFRPVYLVSKYLIDPLQNASFMMIALMRKFVANVQVQD